MSFLGIDFGNPLTDIGAVMTGGASLAIQAGNNAVQGVKNAVNSVTAPIPMQSMPGAPSVPGLTGSPLDTTGASGPHMNIGGSYVNAGNQGTVTPPSAPPPAAASILQTAALGDLATGGTLAGEAQQYLGGNQDLTNYLWGIMSGTGQSAAQQQLYQGLAKEQAGIQSQAQTAMGQGVSPALANYLASGQSTAAQMGTNAQAGILRAQESQAAAGLVGQTNNQSAQLVSNMSQFYTSQGMSAAGSLLTAQLQLAGFSNDQVLQILKDNTSLSEADKQAAMSILGAVVGAVGALGGAAIKGIG